MKKQEEILETFIEIEPLNSDEFLKVKETLTRIGLIGQDENKPILWQSCHIFHKSGKYYIVHFKQMFLLDGRQRTQFTEKDKTRTKFIADLLQRWGLIKVKQELMLEGEPRPTLSIIPYTEKEKYELKPKYTIGSKLKLQD